tara:strand:- start:1170 stop:1523 length:354 start_codon:yes stop_codon:yes gene_type:complete
MPIKKTTAAPAAKKPAVAKKEVAQKPAPKAVSHDHSVLESDIDSLKKEVAILKSALAASVVAHKESDLQLADALELLETKVNNSNLKDVSSKDPRVDSIIKNIKNSHVYTQLRAKYK